MEGTPTTHKMISTQAGAVHDQNNLVIPVTIAELNEQAVNEIYLATLQGEWQGMSPVRQNILLNIVHQCPYIGGPAVFRARALYEEWVTDVVEYDDDNVCLAQGIFRKTNIQGGTEKSPEFILQPNPANDKVTVVYATDKQNNYTLVISDIQGKLIQSINMSGNHNQFTFYAGSILPGLYIVKLFDDDKLIGQSKLSIIR